MSITSMAEALEAAKALIPDEEVLSGLEPALRAHLEDQLAMNPELVEPLRVAALARLVGWGAEE